MSVEFPEATVLSRPRVDALLARAWAHRVSVISAGAGFGKSTALMAGFGGPGRVAFLAMHASDRDVGVLSSRIARAVGAGGVVTVPDSVAGVDDRGAMAEARVATLCQAIPADGDVLLILDDVDMVAGDPDARAFVRSLCLQAPQQMHLTLSGRDVLRAGMWADTRGGDVLEIGASDLAFTRDEVHALLALAAGTPPADEVVQRCWKLTNGWPAAVRLVAEAVATSNGERGIPALSGSSPWRRFAQRVVDSEPDEVRDALDVLSVVGAAGPDLLGAVGRPGDDVALADLAERGLLVVEQNPPGFRLSPVLDRAVRDRLAPGRAADIAVRAAAWLEGSGRYSEALDLYAMVESSAVRAFLARHGHHLIASGAGRRVSEVLSGVGSGGNAALDAIYAQSLWTNGDWEGAVEWFSKAQRSYGDGLLPSSVAWRFGALLYLRGDTEQATSVLARSPGADLASGDDALCLAWLASAQWSRGQVDDAEASAEQASALARASGDARALAAADVALALVAAARGDREANDRYYRAGIAAARSAGDTVQATRICANLASRALEEGRYAEAVEHADAALDLGAGHRFFTGLALSNKAEALLRIGRLEDARACAADSVDAYAACGSLLECGPHLILGEVHRQRGDAVHARLAAERAARLGLKADDLQVIVKAWAALAWILAIDDPVSAGQFADRAVDRATSLGRADALNAAAWVCLCAGNVARAVALAYEGEAEARRTDDRPNLATALELRAAADRTQRQALTEAIALRAKIGDPLALARARLSAGLLDGEPPVIDAARAELIQHGAAVDVGLPRYLDWISQHTPAAAVRPVITTLGRFSLSVDGQPVPTSAWQSRKARDLLKMLAARRGHPITRDAAAEALWPKEGPDVLANRLSVALSVVRRVLDPQRRHPADHFVIADGRSVALRVDRVRLDVVEFFDALHEAEAGLRHGDARAAEAALRRASELYSGDFLEEDRFEDWAIECREQAHSAALTVARQLARAADQRGNDEEAAAYLMRLLERDPYDEAAWVALLGAQVRLRRHGEARRTYARYMRRMGELEIEPMAFEEAARSRPLGALIRPANPRWECPIADRSGMCQGRARFGRPQRLYGRCLTGPRDRTGRESPWSLTPHTANAVATAGRGDISRRAAIKQTGEVAEQVMPGGFVNRVVRAGGTVRRIPGDRADFVHELLRYFEQCGWIGAPRFLGTDEQGREMLTFLEGYVAWQSPTDRVSSVESLVQVARLVRQFHDLTAGTPLAGDEEVVCHNDLSPKNTVYRDGGCGLLPVAFLDWDIAAPGARIHDVAHMCWQYLDLGPAVNDLVAASRRVRLMCDAYGLADRSQVVETILWWQDRCWRGIVAGAEAGDAAMAGLRASGAVRSVRNAYDWVLAHRAAIEATLARS